MTHSTLTAFVLAGGKSTRMGRDKALLQLSTGETLLERTIAVCSNVAPEVKVVGARERYRSFAWAGEIIEDEFEDRGPLAGIHVALKTTATELNLVVAVDMPNLKPELLSYIVERSEHSNALATVPRVEGREQPLCAVYRRGFFDIVDRSLVAGKNKIGALFTPDITLVVDEPELKQHGFSRDLFANTNTPDEWEQTAQSRN